jgi:ppGpp synthetase/RelA/SpoT-type nucleotidyltranferase
MLKSKNTGYRSIHLFTYSSTKIYDGLKLELQIRTKLQHNWAAWQLKQRDNYKKRLL